MENNKSKAKCGCLTDFFKVKKPLHSVKLNSKPIQQSYKFPVGKNNITFKKCFSLKTGKCVKPKPSLRFLKAVDQATQLNTDNSDNNSRSKSKYFGIRRTTDNRSNKRSLILSDKSGTFKRSRTSELNGYLRTSDKINTCDSIKSENVKPDKSFSWDDFFKDICRNKTLDLLNKVNPHPAFNKEENTCNDSNNLITPIQNNSSSSLEVYIPSSISSNESIPTIVSCSDYKHNAKKSGEYDLYKENSKEPEQSTKFHSKEIVIDTVNEFLNEQRMLDHLRRSSSTSEKSFLSTSKINHNQNLNNISKDTPMEVILDNINMFENEKRMLKYLSKPGSTPEKEEYTLSSTVLKNIETIESNVSFKGGRSSVKLSTDKATKSSGFKRSKERTTNDPSNKRSFILPDKSDNFRRSRTSELNGYLRTSNKINTSESINFENVKTNRSFSWDDFFKGFHQNKTLDVLNKVNPSPLFNNEQNISNDLNNLITPIRNDSSSALELDVNISVNSIGFNGSTPTIASCSDSNKHNGRKSGESDLNIQSRKEPDKAAIFTPKEIVMDTVNEFLNEQKMLDHLSRASSTSEESLLFRSEINPSLKTISKFPSMEAVLDNINKFKNEQSMLKYLSQQGSTPEKEEYTLSLTVLKNIETIESNVESFKRSTSSIKLSTDKVTKSSGCKKSKKKYFQETLDDFLEGIPISKSKKGTGLQANTLDNINTFKNEDLMLKYLFEQGCTPEKNQCSYAPVILDKTQDTATLPKNCSRIPSIISEGESVIFSPMVFRKKNHASCPVLQDREDRENITPKSVKKPESLPRKSTESLEQTDVKKSQPNFLKTRGLGIKKSQPTFRKPQRENIFKDITNSLQLQSSLTTISDVKPFSGSCEKSDDSDATIDLFMQNEMVQNSEKNDICDLKKSMQKSSEKQKSACLTPRPFEHLSTDQIIRNIFDSDSSVFLPLSEEPRLDRSIGLSGGERSKFDKKDLLTLKVQTSAEKRESVIASLEQFNHIYTERTADAKKISLLTPQEGENINLSANCSNLGSLHVLTENIRKSSEKQKSSILSYHTFEHLPTEHILKTITDSNNNDLFTCEEAQSKGKGIEFTTGECSKCDKEAFMIENEKNEKAQQQTVSENSCSKNANNNTLEGGILYKTNMLRILIEEHNTGRENKKSKCFQGSQNNRENRKLFKKNNFYIKRYKKGRTKIYKLKRRLMVDKTKVSSGDDVIGTFLSQASQNFEGQEVRNSNNGSLNESMSSVATNDSYGTYNTEKDESDALSVASKNLNSPRYLLRKGMNRISNDKTLLFSYEEDFIPAEKDVEEIQEKIQQIFDQVVEDFNRNGLPKIVFRRQVMSNCVSKNGSLQMKPLERCQLTTIRFGATRSQIRFNLILFILHKIVTLLDSNTKLTKRELYYQLKTEVKNQGMIDRAINTVSCLLDVGMWSLNITAQKGLVFGNLNILLSSGETMNCNVPGTLIPQDVNDIIEIQSTAYFILVVEKESIFNKLLEENLPNRLTRPFIMVTGKGYPDLNTQLFLKKLWMILSVPVFILVDADPDGIKIMLNYKYGSVANAHVSQYLTIPKAKWLGVFPSEIVSLNITKDDLTERECKTVQKLLERPYVRNNEQLAKELNVLLDNKSKAGIEGLLKTETFLSKSYLPTKLFSGNYY